MALGDIYRIRIFCRFAEQVAISVLHATVVATAAPEPSMQQVADDAATAYATAYVNLLSAQTTFSGCGAARIVPAPPLQEAFSVIGAAAGAVVGDALPSQVSGLIAWRTAFGTRRDRGRTYVPFPAEADSTLNAAPSAAYLTRLGTLAITLGSDRTITNGAGFITLRRSIFHRLLGTTTIVTASTVRTQWATQRRRGAFGRPNQLPF